MQSNSQVFADPHKQIAVNVFRNLENAELRSYREAVEKEPDGYMRLYWGARALHLNHLNIIAQAWVMSGGAEDKFRAKFAGVDKLAIAVANHIRSNNPNDENHPDWFKELPEWYKKACSDMYPLSGDFLFGKNFIAFIDKHRHK